MKYTRKSLLVDFQYFGHVHGAGEHGHPQLQCTTNLIVLHTPTSGKTMLPFSMLKDRADEAFVKEMAQHVRPELRVLRDGFPCRCLIRQKTWAPNIFLTSPKTQQRRRSIRCWHATCNCVAHREAQGQTTVNFKTHSLTGRRAVARYISSTVRITWPLGAPHLNGLAPQGAAEPEPRRRTHKPNRPLKELEPHAQPDRDLGPFLN